MFYILHQIMAIVNDFFISSNYVNGISEESYGNLGRLVEIIDSFARTSYQSIYIIDYFKKDFLYVSDNPLFLCGLSAEDVKNLGYLFYINYVPRDEQNMLVEINSSGFKFFSQLPLEERIKYTISYDFHLINNKRKILINHKLTPSVLSNDGKIWLATCVVSLSSRTSVGHIEIRKMNEINYWEYSLESHKWKEKEGLTLNNKEKDILYLSAQGYTMNEIADKLCLAVDTIKFYKRRLFDRLEVKNIAEALSYVKNYKLL